LSKSSAKTGKGVKTDVSITKRGPTEGRRQKPTLNPKIFKATRSGRIPKKTIFLNSVSLLVEESKVVHIDEELTLSIPTAPFKAITIKEAMKTDLQS